MHCAGYGAELGVHKIVVPVTSMAHSAYGALAADVQHSNEQSLLMRGGGGPLPLWEGLDPEVIEDGFVQLEAECRAAMARAGVAAEDVAISRVVDLRYRRRTNDLMIAMPERPATQSALEALVDRFEHTYEQNYGKGSAFREAGLELTNVRVEAFGKARRPELRFSPPNGAPKAGTRKIFEPVANKWMDAAVYHWRELPKGFKIPGPAVIEHPETSVFVAARQIARLDEDNNITIELRGDA